MKNSKKYSEKIEKLYRKLKKKYKKIPEISWEDPVEAMVFAIVSEDRTISESEKIMKRLKKDFVDFNDLRVALREEIIESLKGDKSLAKNTTLALSKALRCVFKRYNTTSLADLTEKGKRDARSELEEIDGISEFVIEYVFLTALEGHAIPLTESMINYLRHNELVHPDANRKDIEGFLSRIILSDDAYEFYYLLRTEARKNPPSKKTKQKTEKKKTGKSGSSKKKTRKKSKKKKTKSKRKSKKKTKTKNKKGRKKKG